VAELIIDQVLIDPDALQQRVAELGEEISSDYAGRNVLFVCVLKGAVFFVADLMRHVTVPCEVDFMAVSSYGNELSSSGEVRILKDLDGSIEGRDIVIVEDIIDSGRTLTYLIQALMARQPNSIEICALLTKPDRREVDVDCRYVGFEIPNRFVVGYGLDFSERYRNLDYIAAVDEHQLPTEAPSSVVLLSHT
jgi:hypoxanthine phosphoribosyltransferase